MADVVAADVHAIFDTGMDTTPFIVTARVFLATYKSQAGWVDDLYFEIWRWTAAHFACMRDPRETDVKRLDTSIAFEHGPLGQGLKATRYGQQAIALDPTGILATASEPQRTLFEVF